MAATAGAAPVTTQYLQLINTVAQFNERLGNLEEALELIKTTLTNTQTGAIKNSNPLPAGTTVELTADQKTALVEHSFFGELYTQDDIVRNQYHITAPSHSHRNENGAWEGGSVGPLYLGGVQQESFWRQHLMLRLVTNRISFIYPAFTPERRVPITRGTVSVVIAALDVSNLAIAAFAEIIRAFGVGLVNVFVVAERFDALGMPNDKTLTSSFRAFVEPWQPRAEITEMINMVKYIAMQQCITGIPWLFPDIDACVTTVVYTHKNNIFSRDAAHMATCTTQLDTLAYLLTNHKPKSDCAWILLYAFAKLVMDNAREIPGLADLCRSKNIDLEMLYVHIRLCQSLKTNKDIAEDLRAALHILFPTSNE